MKHVRTRCLANRIRCASATLVALAMFGGQAMHLVAAPTVELLRDPWGTPHIFAAAEADGFFGLGYAAAEDRLLQMELIRRKAAGRLAEVFGPDWVDADPEPLCDRGWEASRCARQFSHPPTAHETLLGLLPMNTRASQRLLQQVRPWIEPAQSYEKNQLGLSEVFLNSLRLTWAMSLLVDAAVRLRARVLLDTPVAQLPMFELTPRQLVLDLPM